MDDLHDLLDHLSNLPASDRERRLGELEADGVAPGLVDRARLYFSIPTDPAELKPGVTIGDYTLEERVGEGGMGIVYRARQKSPNRLVALKTIHPAFVSSEFYRRFDQEIRTLSELEFPGIVPIYGGGKFSPRGDRSIPYYTMELVRGRRVTEYVRGENLPLPLTLKLVIDILEALQFAHDRGIVHRDLKPGNLMVREDRRPVILDFGLAQFAHELPPRSPRAHADLSFSGVSGTPYYMCPELFMARARSPVSLKSADVYSMGIVLFELLAGRLPHTLPGDPSFEDVRTSITSNSPARLSQCQDNCPPEIDEIVHTAMHKDPVKRYDTASDFAKALIFFLEREFPKALVPPSASLEPLSFWQPSVGNLLPPTQWRIVRRLGSGSVGEVWLAQHEDLGEKRAIKFCRDPKSLRSLKREQVLLRRLSQKLGSKHSFVRIKEVSLDDPPYYIGMDFVDGEELQLWFAEQGGGTKVKEATKLELVAQIAEALQVAHNVGIIHRDVKPSNVLVSNSARGESTPRAVLTDFGIGTVVSSEILAATRTGFGEKFDTLTEEQIGVGSFTYMPPEALDGADHHVASTQSDIFSLGVLLFQFLVGDFNRTLPRRELTEIDDPILRADILEFTAHDPAKRPDSVGEIAQRMRSIDARRNAAANAETERRHVERIAYRRGLMKAGLAAAVIVAVFAVLTWIAVRESNEAESASERAVAASVEAMFGEAAAKRSSTDSGRSFGSIRLLQKIEESQPDHPRTINDYIASLLLPDFEIVDSPSLPAGAFSPLLNQSIEWSGNIVTKRTQRTGGLEVTTHTVGGAPITDARLSSTGKYLATKHKDGATLVSILSSVEGGTCDLVLNSPADSLAQLSFDSADGHVASAESDGSLLVHELPSGAAVTNRPLRIDRLPYTLPASDLAFRPGTSQVAVASQESLFVLLWDWRSGELIQEIHHPFQVRRLAWGTGGNWLGTISIGGDVQIWRCLRDGTCLAERRRSFRDDVPLSLAFTRRGEFISVGTRSGKLFLWNWAQDSVVENDLGIGSIEAVEFAADDSSMVAHSDLAATALRVNTARYYSAIPLAQDASERRRGVAGSQLSEAFIQRPRSVDIHPDGWVALVSHDRGVSIVDLFDQRVVGTLKLPDCAGAGFDQSGSRIIAGSRYGIYRWEIGRSAEDEGVWKLPRAEALDVPAGDILDMAISADRTTGVALYRGKIHWFAVHSEREPEVIRFGQDGGGSGIGTDEAIDSLRLSADGRSLAVGIGAEAKYYLGALASQTSWQTHDGSISEWRYFGNDIWRPYHLQSHGSVTGDWKWPPRNDAWDRTVYALNEAVDAGVIFRPDEGALFLFDLRSDEIVFKIPTSLATIDAMALGSAGLLTAATRIGGGTLHVWNLGTLISAMSEVGEFSPAMAVRRRFASRSPNSPAYAVIDQGDLPTDRPRTLAKIESIDRQLQEKDGMDAELWKARGEHNLTLRRLGEVKKDLDRAIEQMRTDDSNLARTYYHRALAQFEDPYANGVFDVRGALSDAEMALELDRHGEVTHLAHLVAGFSHYRLGEYERALIQLNNSIAGGGGPALAGKHLGRAACLLELKNMKEAHAAFAVAAEEWAGYRDFLDSIPSFYIMRTDIERRLSTSAADQQTVPNNP